MNKYYKMLLTASLLASFGGNLIGPFYAVFVKEIGGDILDMGYTVTLYTFCTGVLMILIGKVSDKLNKELIAVFGYTIYAIASLLYIFITSPWQLFGLQIVFAISVACLSAPLTALFAKHIKKEKEGEQWGFSDGGNYLASSLAVFVGTFIVDRFGFNVLFISMFIIQFLAAIIQARFYFITKKTTI